MEAFKETPKINIVQSFESENIPVTKEENVGTKQVLVMPGSGNTKQRTSLSFNFQW